MSATDAVILENWIPMKKRIEMRKGFAEHVTGLTGNVETLMPWSGPTSEKLFGCANNEIFDVSSAGAVGAAVVTGLASNRFQYINFPNAAGSFLLCVNGADTGRTYNGSTWANFTTTGLTTDNASNIFSHKKRVFLIEKDSLSFWYLAVSAISGAAAEFDLGSLCELGGYLVAGGTWSVDGGSGLDDLAVFITSEGETIIYQGTDPGDATAWSLVGVFRLGRPIGKRCFVKLGSDLVVLTEDGFVPLSSSLVADRSVAVAISDKIAHSVNESFIKYGSNFGWCAAFYPTQSLVLFNIPINASKSEQYVMNTHNRSWCKFTGMNAFCWATLGGNLYFGGNGVVYQALTGTTDNSASISGVVKPAFSYFGRHSQLKKMDMVRPVMDVNGNLTVALEACMDFEDRIPRATPTFSTGSSPWGSPWDITPWTVGETIKKDWQSVTGVGYAGTVHMNSSSQLTTVALYSFDYLYRVGAYV